MMVAPTVLEERCAEILRRHVASGDEPTLHEAYEFGRQALADGVGVMEITVAILRAAEALGLVESTDGDATGGRVESFALECLSSFEMAHRGAGEASAVLRELDDRREEMLGRVARELHDQAGSLLASVHIALEGMRPHLDAAGLRRLSRADALLHQVEDSIRRISHELRPALLDDLGLLPALRFLAEGVTQRSGLEVQVTGSTSGRLPPAVETVLYRAAQEAITNVTRHACATSIDVQVKRTGHAIRCRIRDDGRGFDPGTELVAGRRRGHGIDGMRERLAPLGGELQILSERGRGTELVFHIPLEVSHGDACPDRG
ncbi:MAG: ATP-binding protein [Candidatus Eisenbacteria bacterium]|nr:ATP-binding protein [Candidatus Eisenbacteria bacterium]